MFTDLHSAGLFIKNKGCWSAGTKHRSQVSFKGLRFTNTETNLNIAVKANLKPKNSCLGLIKPNVSVE